MNKIHIYAPWLILNAFTYLWGLLSFLKEHDRNRLNEITHHPQLKLLSTSSNKVSLTMHAFEPHYART
jgi:hypothetical protein